MAHPSGTARFRNKESHEERLLFLNDGRDIAHRDVAKYQWSQQLRSAAKFSRRLR
ncbi:hypothetical protein [Microvirga alba]|uniref:Uncharacterized protein n=1 Tax=Microvirga alba TaxID=2791025 RepID=A0A931BT88_9HYPH|nr:hypothetical protein [Microvirga alba]MBF9232397.1 hypothetical protein [Microvirga alba]